MWTGSAAQPRNGTAPNAPAARMPPVFRRNSRRPCRLGKVWFDKACFRLAWRLTESLRSFFMPFPPARWRDKLLSAVFEMLAPSHIVYNTVIDIIFRIENYCLLAMLRVAPGRRARRPNRGN